MQLLYLKRVIYCTSVNVQGWWLNVNCCAVNLSLQGLRAYENHPRLLAPWHARFLDTVQVRKRLAPSHDNYTAQS
jgi:hypothetical protein